MVNLPLSYQHISVKKKNMDGIFKELKKILLNMFFFLFNFRFLDNSLSFSVKKYPN